MPPENPDLINRIPATGSAERVRKYFNSQKFDAGYQIDPQIKETIVTLNTLGFPTSYSCEGWNPKHPYWRAGRDRMDQGAAEMPYISLGDNPGEFDPELLEITFGKIPAPEIAARIKDSRAKLRQLLEMSGAGNISVRESTLYKESWYLQGTGGPPSVTTATALSPEKLHADQLKAIHDFTAFLNAKYL